MYLGKSVMTYCEGKKRSGGGKLRRASISIGRVLLKGSIRVGGEGGGAIHTNRLNKVRTRSKVSLRKYLLY